MEGKVYLVGAGPGDPGLITLKAKRVLSEAEVVVYDYLAHKRIMAYVPNFAERIYVGKQAGRHTLSQKEINQLLIEKAREGKVVVRLKGGDPFIFGRGGEEAEALAKENVPFEIVPGVSSAIAVPAYAGIPLTHRSYASSVAFVTGHEDPTKVDSAINWEKLAMGVDTLVFLMGVGNLPFIVQKLIENGRSPKTPVAIVRWGTLPEQRTIVGNLEDIAELAKRERLRPPAIIVVGEVVNLRDLLNWWEEKPLFGKKILITRTREQAAEMAMELEDLGARCYIFPTIEVTDPSDFSPLDSAISNISLYDWLIFTSVNGVYSFKRRLKKLGRDVRILGDIKIAVIGEKTSKALEDWGIRPDLMPSEFRAEALAEEILKSDIRGKKVLLVRAEKAREVLPEKLKEMGARVDIVPAYRTVVPQYKRGEIEDILKGGIDVITFTSSSTVIHLAKILDGDIGLLKDIAIACIGPITEKTAKDLGLKVDIMPDTYTTSALVKAIVSYFTS